ncbi:hypothetical protein LguiA_025686 [Lonicera macranthoides]
MMMVMSKTTQRRFLFKTAEPGLPSQEQTSTTRFEKETNVDKLARYGVLEREMEVRILIPTKEVIDDLFADMQGTVFLRGISFPFIVFPKKKNSRKNPTRTLRS